jgi:hypothetical protein
MSFLSFALRMFPYWSFGALMGWAVWKSDHKDLLRFQWKSFLKFFLFMAIVSVYRYAMLRLAIHSGMHLGLEAVTKLPIGAVFFTPWENLTHSIPLVLLRRMIGTSKWTWPIHALAMVVVMISFGLGHTYEGIFAACFISLAVPFDIYWGQKVGFGTTMAAHVWYDLSTIMTIRMALGL